MKTVCLDAGHYGDYNESPAVKGYFESRMNWQLQGFLKQALESCGIAVKLTRQVQGKDLDLVSRGRASKGCDLFLSLHSNAAGSAVNESVDYVVAYSQLDGKGDKLGQALADTVARLMETKQPPRVSHRKGSRGEYYGVLRGASAVGTVGLILEHSFHTNTHATRWLMEPENLRRLAQEEAKVIAAYLGVQPKLYRVQIGAYTRRENAQRQAEKARALGFADAFVAEVTL